LGGLQSGELDLKGETFVFREKERSPKEVNKLFKLVDKELESDIERLQRLDREMFLAHWSAATILDGEGGGGREADLRERYKFHSVVQGRLQEILDQQAKLHAVLNLLQQNDKLSQEDLNQLLDELCGVRQTISRSLKEAKQTQTPALTNVAAGTSLYLLIADRSDTSLGRLNEETLTGEWLVALLTRLEGVLSRLRRIHFKSLGSLLACQERLVREWNGNAAGDAPPEEAAPVIADHVAMESTAQPEARRQSSPPTKPGRMEAPLPRRQKPSKPKPKENKTLLAIAIIVGGLSIVLLLLVIAGVTLWELLEPSVSAPPPSKARQLTERQPATKPIASNPPSGASPTISSRPTSKTPPAATLPTRKETGPKTVDPNLDSQI
jgi:hypothetical protein